MEINITSEISNKEWQKVAYIIAKAIPNTIISKLGTRFGAAFYSKIAEQTFSCCYVAKDELNNIAGVVIGTTDYPKARMIAFKGQLAKLTMAANYRLFKWSVINWAIKGILAKDRSEKQDHAERPLAELVVIAVRTENRGMGLAQQLVKEMEKFMVSKGLNGPYTILTEKANARANRFYEKIGATLVRSNLHHGRGINEWHKKIAVAKQDE